MSRLRTAAGWLPAVLLVPTALVAIVEVSAPSDADERAMDQVQPLDPGTTWVYAVSDHGRPSGHRVRQVLGPSQLLLGTLRSGVRVSSVYDNYPGSGRRSTDVYVGVEGRQLLQYGLVANGGQLELDPPAPAYELPAEEGTSFEYEGTLGPSTAISASTEVTDEGDVEVGGHTFHDCTEWTSHQQTDGEDAVEVLVEWTCPGIGVVRSHDVYEPNDADVTEELVAFHGVEQEWTAEPASGTPPPLGEATAEGVDQGRSRAVPDGVLTDTLAWTDSRSRVTTFSPVAAGDVEVVGEPDGLVSAQDVGTGEVRWQVGLPPPVVAAPATGGGLVFVADGAKNLWALSLRDGSAQWVHHFDDVVAAVPVVGEQAVAVVVEDGTVAALARTDGAELWSATLGDRATTAPALAGQTLVVGDGSGSVTAFDLATGDQQWSASLEDGLEQGPAVADGHVLVSDGAGVVTSLDQEDGSVQWQAKGRDYPDQPLAAGGGSVVTVGERDRVEAFDLGTGRRAWSREVPGADAAPVVVGDQVVTASETGRLHVLDLADGDRADSWSPPAPVPGARLEPVAPLAVIGDSLVVTVQVASELFSSTSYAYRIGGGDAPPGATLTVGAATTVPYPPTTPSVVDGADTYSLAMDGVLYRDSGDGPVPLVEEIAPKVGFAARDGVVVVPRGDEVWAVRGSDGKRLWKLPAGDAFVESLPALTDDTAFVPVQGTGLIAVGLRDGTPAWVAPTPGAAGSSTPLPLPGGDVAYAAGGLARYDGRTGEVVWRLGGDLADAVAYTEPTLADGVVYALLVQADQAGAEQTHLVAVDARTGTVRWRRQVKGAPFGIGPAAGDGTVAVVDATNRALVIDAATGTVRWTFQLATEPLGPPTVHDGVVVLTQRGRSEDFRQRDFRVTAHDAATGTFLASYQPPVANHVTLPTGASGPDGQTLVPTAGSEAAFVLSLEAARG